MKKKTLIIIILLFVVLIICIPIIIDWVIIGNNIPSNINNSDWVGFLGGYSGALIGGVISFIGIVLTIRYTNEQNRIHRELQVKPYCSIRHVHDDKLVGTNKLLFELTIGCEPSNNQGPRYTSILYIKNIGLGPAIEFNFKVDEIDDGREHYPVFTCKNAYTSNHSVNLLQPNDEAALPIYIWFNFDRIEESDIEEYKDGDMAVRHVKQAIMNKYKDFNIILHMEYKDMFMNQYYQKITLTSTMSISYKTDIREAEHNCNLYLKEITNPKLISKL